VKPKAVSRYFAFDLILIWV